MKKANLIVQITVKSGLLKSLEGEVDYVIMDFPGSFNKSDAVCHDVMYVVLNSM